MEIKHTSPSEEMIFSLCGEMSVSGFEERGGKLLRERFGADFDEIYGARLTPYIRSGFLVDDAHACRFTTKGFLVSNTVLSDVLDFEQNG